MWVDVLNQGIEEGYFRPDLDVDLVYRFIRDTTWVSVRWYQPGGPLTAEQVGRQYLAIVLGGITADTDLEGDIIMPEAYIVDAVRTPVGKKNGSLAGGASDRLGRVRISRAVRPRRRRSGRGRRRHRGLRRRDRRAGGQHRPQRVAGGGLSRRGPRRDRRPSVRVQPAGDFLWRAGDHVRHGRRHPGRRHAEHEPGPDRLCDGGRQGVRLHLADGRVGELAASLRRRGDLAVPRRRADRRAVEHLPRGNGAVRADQPPACVRAIRGGHFDNEIIGVGRLPHRRGPARDDAGEDGRRCNRWPRAVG